MLDPYFDRKSFKKLKGKVAPIVNQVVEKDVREELTAKVSSFLLDAKQENINRMEELIVEWHRGHQSSTR